MSWVLSSVEEDTKEPEQIFNPIDRIASERDKAQQLAELSANNVDQLTLRVAELDGQGKTVSQVNRKATAKIEEKARRPATRSKYPWFRVEHIRDALRFRSVIRDIASFEVALEFLAKTGMPVVKVDLEKMCHGNTWGWRCAALDFRFPAANDQLVEYYVTFAAVMQANDGPCHKLYEEGREVSVADPNVDVQGLMERSQREYGKAWAAALKALGVDQAGFERSWRELRTRLNR